MPTARSMFNIAQFEAKLQKMAHKFPKFKQVRTDDLTLIFYYTEDGKPRKVVVLLNKKTGKKLGEGTAWEHDEVKYWRFTIEAKIYLNSNHATKISFTYKENDEKIKKWLEEIMGSEKPVPRFTLSKYTGGQRYLDLTNKAST